MADLWYAIVAFMLTAFVVLDGADFGAGMLHRLVARSEDEHRRVLSAIGPFWDGNEVWLLAAGGALFLAFPRVLSAGLSGFYFAIFLVIWCLIGRGVAIEFRSHLADPLWRSFWDTVFALTSLLLALFFGVALGNVVRGVPLDAEGWFALPLFTDFSMRMPVGILDPYTLLVGVFAVVMLLGHGAAFVACRADGELRARIVGAGGRARLAALVLWPVVTWATAAARPGFFTAFAHRPLAWLGVTLALGGAIAAILAPRRGAHGAAWSGSSAWVAGLLVATAACAAPELLHALPDAAHSLTTANAAAPVESLRGALAWFVPGVLLAIGYQVVIARLHPGPVKPTEYGGE